MQPLSSYYHILPGSLVAGLLICLPLTFWWQYSEPDMWNGRLALPKLELQAQRHTPRFATGTFLPPRLTRNLTLSSSDSPVIVRGSVVIPAPVTLTIEAGTQVVFHEFSQISVEGQLRIVGSPKQPVTLASNEQHRFNQAWNGLLFKDKSQGAIQYAHVQSAHPAISCLEASRVTIDHLTVYDTSLAIFKTSPDCTIASSRIHHWH